MRTLAFILFFARSAFACDVLVIDLNNSKDEIRSCREGVYANNKKKGTDDDIGVVGDGEKITMSSIRATLQEYARNKDCIDTVAFSGHQIAGQFTGANGTVDPHELADVMAEFPNVFNGHVRTSELWGCYSDVLVRCQNDYLKAIHPDIATAVGFGIQSPSNAREIDWNVIRYFCQTRKEAADAQDAASMNDYVNNAPGHESLSLALCIDGAICSQDYKVPHSDDKNCYHSWKELERRCGKKEDYDPNGLYAKIYNCFFEARKPECRDVPLDEDPKTHIPTNSPLRQAYAHNFNLWAHCPEGFQGVTPGAGGDPVQGIHLVKFTEFKNNIARRNAKQIAQYNEKLEELGLGQYSLDGMNKMSRGDIIDRITGAVNALDGMKEGRPAPVVRKKSTNVLDPFGLFSSDSDATSARAAPSAPSSANPVLVQRMAMQISATLIDLQTKCGTDANLLHPDAESGSSPCIKNYGAR